MKLTNDQRSTVKQLVAKEVKFNETYLELYDHIITAIEHRNAIPNIETAYTEILEQDLGGKEGIMRMEKGMKKAIKKAVQKRYLANFLLFLKWPGISIVALLCAIAYFDIILFDTSFILALIFVTCFILPWCFLVMRNFIAGFKLKEVKDPYFNSVMTDIGILPFRIYFLAKAVILALSLQFGLKLEMGTYVEHGYFVLLIIHAIVFYGMSINQLRTSLKYEAQ